MAAQPVIATAVQERLQVAAIDFGTTYSGYAFSFRSDFTTNPLKIHTNKWESSRGSCNMVSMKAPSCVLFTSDQEFHSFGYEAEEHYSKLATEGNHNRWYFYKRFKMLLYENKDLKRIMQLPDDKGLKMPALKVFSECIRYLKEHLISLGEEKDIGLRPRDIHWVLTVPAIWDDSAKQFMREAAVEAGIKSDHLSLALEPEAASLFCRHLPVKKVRGADGTAAITNFAPGKRYLVLDAGGGTVDITVHETQPDGTVRELYKANGGPWGGTRVDQAFVKFLEDIAGKNVVDKFTRNFKEDYIDLFREFEIKKKTFEADMDPDVKITFRIPLTLHDTFKDVNGEDFRRSLMMQQTMKDQVTFTGDKLRVYPQQVRGIFEETCNQIVRHLKTIFAKPAVQGTETILMVGGFSESKMLQDAIRKNFSNMRVIIPEDAGLAVLMGAVIFGHNPSAIISRVSRYTYGVEKCSRFDPTKHLESKKVVIDGIERCDGCYSKHVEIDQEVYVGMQFEEKIYHPVSKKQKRISSKVYTSTARNPKYIDGCTYLGKVTTDISDIERERDKKVAVRMIYGNTELGLVARKVKTGEFIEAKFDFLG